MATAQPQIAIIRDETNQGKFQSQPCDGDRLTSCSVESQAPAEMQPLFQSQLCDGGRLTIAAGAPATVSGNFLMFQSQRCDGGRLTVPCLGNGTQSQPPGFNRNAAMAAA